MPHQEVYLAFLDQQASGAMALLEEMLHDTAKSTAARSRAEAIAKTIQTQFYDSQKSCYAFSRNVDGSLDRTSTVYPSLGWWSGKGLAGDASIPTQAGTCLQQFAGHALNTDWGLRDVANDEKIYDGMSYHQGSVWPLFTGWAALAEYRAQPAARGLPIIDGEREFDEGAGSRRRDGIVVWRLLCALWAQHEPPTMVERDGDHANAARTVRH